MSIAPPPPPPPPPIVNNCPGYNRRSAEVPSHLALSGTHLLQRGHHATDAQGGPLLLYGGQQLETSHG